MAREAEELQELVLGVAVASGVLGVLALLGLLTACSRRGGLLRGGASGLYLVGSLPASAALGFVGVYALTFRQDLLHLAQSAQRCLQRAPLTDDNGADEAAAAAAVQRGIGLSTALLLGSAAPLLLGVVCVGQLIGWRNVARNLMVTANGGTLLIGLGLQAVAAALRARWGASGHADDVLLALGAAASVVALLGLLSTRPSRLGRCLLPLYMLCLALMALGLAGLELSFFYGGDGSGGGGDGGGVAGAGMASLDAELDAHWAAMRDEVGLTLSKQDFVASLRHHRLVLAIAAGSLLVEVFLLLASAWILHCFISQPTYVRAASEMTNLLDEEEE